MRYFHISFLLGLSILFHINVYSQTKPDFSWGNAFYFNISLGETIEFNSIPVKLLKQKNHYNLFKIGEDTLWLKVSRRTLPVTAGNLRIFVADNKNVKALTNDSRIHGLLKKDALICLSDVAEPIIDNSKFVFPVSFNDGFLWSVEEDKTMFAFETDDNKTYYSHPGIDFDISGARKTENQYIVAIENSSVVRIKNNTKKDVCVLLKSSSQPGIYYIYNHLYKKYLNVKGGDKVVINEPLGTIWGDEKRRHLQFAVIKSDTIPQFETCFYNTVNCFPQIFALYFNQDFIIVKKYTKGKIVFGMNDSENMSVKNILEYEEFAGKGWKTGTENIADRVERVEYNGKGNARLRKTMFKGTRAEFTNNKNYYDYEINSGNGVFRIRAKVGDAALDSWQRIQFESVTAGTYKLSAGEFKWTSEKVVKIKDGKLTIRIFIDNKNNKPAGLSEIVFQQIY